jgi:hypothetical protein
LGARNGSPFLLSYSLQEAKEKEAESRAKAKREAEKVLVLESLHHNERVQFCHFSKNHS